MAREDGVPIGLVLATAALLLAIALGYSFVYLDRSGVQDPASRLIVLGLPISAALLYVAIGIIVPGLFARRRLAFPLNVTLPIVYASLLVLSVLLWTSPGNALVAVNEVVRPARVWLTPYELVRLGLLQALALTVPIAFRRR